MVPFSGTLLGERMKLDNDLYVYLWEILTRTIVIATSSRGEDPPHRSRPPAPRGEALRVDRTRWP